MQCLINLDYQHSDFHTAASSFPEQSPLFFSLSLSLSLPLSPSLSLPLSSSLSLCMQLNCFPQEKEKKKSVCSLQFAQTESDSGSAKEWITEQKLCSNKGTQVGLWFQIIQCSECRNVTLKPLGFVASLVSLCSQQNLLVSHTLLYCWHGYHDPALS